MAASRTSPWFGAETLDSACSPVENWGNVLQELAYMSRKGRVVEASTLNEDGSEFRVSLAMRRPLQTETRVDDDAAAMWDGAHEWYYEVIYRVDALPSELAELGPPASESSVEGFVATWAAAHFQRLELKILGEMVWCFVLSRGYDLTTFAEQCDEVRRRQFLIDMECGVMKAKLRGGPVVAPVALQDIDCRRASVTNFADMMARQPGGVLYVGSGVSGDSIVLGNAMERLLQVDKTVAVDDFTRNVLKVGDEGIDHIASVLTSNLLQPLMSTQPSDAHMAIAALSRAERWPVVTTNSDTLLEHAGVEPSRLVTHAQVEAVLSAHALRDRSVLICIGVGDDHKAIISRFRQLRPDGIVAAFVLGTIKPYLSPADWLVEGDVQLTLPKLAEQFGVPVTSENPVLVMPPQTLVSGLQRR
eukprot:TRINITY_DN76129_c0_g1_i1.p1 TRINITY_DN76129_c0_g1~~TRINITY_DN76129_c0_g1_i1.p1  ORF type:complete len:428 (-),score=75.28 TRINITY_DN76129_c0_g1_i1:53-1303(-)